VWRIATWLIRRGASLERPAIILSDNSVEQALLTLGAMHVGVPVAPVSPAYSLQSNTYHRLKSIVDQVRPGVIYVADHARFGAALAAIRGRHDALIISGSAVSDSVDGCVAFDDVMCDLDADAVDRRFRQTGPDSVAKLMFTSGSTGDPKGVITTQRMLCSNQQARMQVWPFLQHEPPVLVDWLPWSHTFGGNHNFNLVLAAGGTLYIDSGRPAPALFDTTIANLRDIAPTIHFNVPRGYDMLVPVLRRDDELRQRFFSRLRVIFYAAAALPQHLWLALGELSQAVVGEPIPLCSAWGTTETAPLATDCHFHMEKAGVIGLPVPGTELKLVPVGEQLEIRVRGPNITPGYWKRPDLTASAFDEENFYLPGDAVRFADEAHPERGLVFDGRLAEDFKLDTGTWVRVGALRVRAISALSPVAQDVVVTGHDRGEIGLLVFPNRGACCALAGIRSPDAPVDEALDHPVVRDVISRGLSALRDEGPGSSTYATRAIILREPPSIDLGEITDKGHINQRAVLQNRAELVDELYSDTPGVTVIHLST
jgi:feruloyl-CoA synthase